MGRFGLERPAWPALGLSDLTCTLTAVANDYGYEHIFARQIEALAEPGDCLVALTTSGRSPNILAAIRAARRQGMVVAALTGGEGLPPEVASAVDLEIRVERPPHATDGLTTPHIQETHIAVLHSVAAGAERALVRGSGAGRPPTPGRPRRAAAFLDRDGTLVTKRDLIDHPDQLELLPGAALAVRRLNEAGIAAVLTTNQAAVGRRQLSEETLCRIHARLQELLADAGACLDAVYHCPHPALCACRKPMPGMMLRAAAELHLDLGASCTIGDTWHDVRAGLASGGSGALVRTGLGHGLGSPGEALWPEAAGRWGVFPNVGAAVAALTAGGSGRESS